MTVVADRPDDVPASSILGQLFDAVEEQAEGFTKVLPVARTGLYAEYRALDDDKRDEYRSAARTRAKQRARTGSGDDDPDGERQAAAVTLATACVQLMTVATDDTQDLADKEGYVPLHLALARGGHQAKGPVRFNKDLVDLLAYVAKEKGEPVPGGMTSESKSSEVVAALHRNGKSSSPLTSTYALYEAWAAGITPQVVAEAIGGDV